MYAHASLSASERQQALRNAKVVDRAQANAPGVRPIRHQATLEKTIKKAVGPSRLETVMASKGSGSTRSFATFSEHHPILVSFREWLQGIDGREKSPAAALAISKDVNKYLKFSNPSKLTLNTLVHRNTILKYMDSLKKAGIGVDGMSTKLDNIVYAIRFTRSHFDEEQSQPFTYDHMRDVLDSIKVWKASLGKGRREKAQRKLEQLSEGTHSLDDITEVVDNSRMWEHFDRILSMCQVGDPALTQPDLKLAMGAVLVTTLLKSFQRPGAVTNATLKEYRLSVKEGENRVIKVVNHKTSVHGSAKLLFDSKDWKRLFNYITYIRPRLAGKRVSYRFFVREGGEPVEKVQALMESLAKKFGFKPLSATMGRKIGATEAISHLSAPKTALVTSQMRHTQQTEARHYRAIVVSRHAAWAFNEMEALRKQPETTKEEPSQKKRKAFKKEENDVIRHFFKQQISEDRAPTLTQCLEKENNF